jgi:hypothetical protein
LGGLIRLEGAMLAKTDWVFEETPRDRLALLLRHFSRIPDERELWRLVFRLAEALVSIDGMGCQFEIADKIVANGADYLLALKGNRRKVQMAQAALLGQMTTGFPVSPLTPATFLVVGLCGIELADHQRFSIPFLFGASVVITVACVVLGVFPL